ncbi:hypothetical protein ACWDAZ_30160, partial [Streptomyces sp. NPDC001215]
EAAGGVFQGEVEHRSALDEHGIECLAAGRDRLPDDVRPGDLLAVPVAGAYHLSMASGYNMVGRPPVTAVKQGHARLLVRRESLDDIRRRDVGL